jgi:hypothetical protein
MTHAIGSLLTRRLRLSAATNGYILLAASAIFLGNLIYQVSRFEVLDVVVGVMVGVVGIYILIAALMITSFSRATAATPAAEVGDVGTARDGGGGGTGPARPHLRLLTFDSSDTPARDLTPGREDGVPQRPRRAA